MDKDTSGFYKKTVKEQHYARTFIANKTQTLHRKDKGKVTFPVGGWHWFDSVEEAVVGIKWEVDDEPGTEEEEKAVEMVREKSSTLLADTIPKGTLTGIDSDITVKELVMKVLRQKS